VSVYSPARPADSNQACNDWFTLAALTYILQPQPQGRSITFHHFNPFDETLFFENSGYLGLDFGAGHRH
jgi:hypothetical protein